MKANVVTTGRLLEAFSIAPVVTALFFTIFVVVSWVLDPQGPNWHGPLDVLRDVGTSLLIYGLSGVIVTIFLGLPAWFLFRWLGLQSWLAFAVGGAVIGVATAIILAALGMVMFVSRNGVILAGICSLVGLLSALAFRAVAFRGSGETQKRDSRTN
jgi:hypothetical protein